MWGVGGLKSDELSTYCTYTKSGATIIESYFTQNVLSMQIPHP